MLNSQDISAANEERKQRRNKIALAAGLLLLEDDERSKKEKEKLYEEQRRMMRKRSRTVWVRDWLTRRQEFGLYDKLLEELHKEDIRGYKNYLRITPDLFQEMVERLTPYLEKK